MKSLLAVYYRRSEIRKKVALRPIAGLSGLDLLLANIIDLPVLREVSSNTETGDIPITLLVDIEAKTGKPLL